jgi:uncharacterized protein YqhQ
MIALVSIAVFTVIGTLLPRIQTGSAVVDNLIFFLEKLPFLPVIAAVTFELQRVFARFCTTGPLRALLWPGFLVQKITTIEPDDDQLEVALAALRATLFREESTGSKRVPYRAPRRVVSELRGHRDGRASSRGGAAGRAVRRLSGHAPSRKARAALAPLR